MLFRTLLVNTELILCERKPKSSAGRGNNHLEVRAAYFTFDIALLCHPFLDAVMVDPLFHVNGTGDGLAPIKHKVGLTNEHMQV